MFLTISLLLEDKFLLKVGQKVDFDTPLFEEKKSEALKIYLSQKLKVAPDQIFHHLKKFVGDEIKKGDLLAEKKSFFDNKKFLSDVEGVLKEIDHNDGSILLELKNTEKKTNYCFFKGEVSAVEKGKIKIKVNHLKDYPLKEMYHLDKQYLGSLVYYFDERNSNYIEEEIRDRIIVVSQLNPYHQIKLETLNAHGFISLHTLPDSSSLPWVKLKNIDDIKKIFDTHLPYCIIDRKESKIIFYS